MAAVTSTASPECGLAGRLYRYRTSPNALQCFESPGTDGFKKYCVYLGGLTDGLLACAYVEPLASELERRGWALVQPVISSSYLGYGCGSLNRDSRELGELLDFLVAHRGCTDVALVGHSTGCQNAVHFMRHAPRHQRSLVRACGLQAPVSDREAAWKEERKERGGGGDAAADGSIEALLLRSTEMVAAGRGHEIVTMQYGFAPISAHRYLDLTKRGGADDLFSSDFADVELASLLGHMSTAGQHALEKREEEEEEEEGSQAKEPHRGLRSLVAFSMLDEYVIIPEPDRSRHVQRLCAAMASASSSSSPDVVALELDGASHNLKTPPEAAPAFVQAVGELLSSVA